MTQEFADNRLYLVVHQALRRILGRFVNATERRDPQTLAPLLVDRWGTFVRLLHHHHEGEDEKFFPAIASASPQSKPLIAKLEAEHQELVPLLDQADAAVARLAQQPSAESLRAVHDAIKAVKDMLVPHLDIEDAELLPIAASSVDYDEWERLGEEALKSLPKKDLPIAAGALDEQAQAVPESERPPPPPLPIRVLLALSWRRRYRNYIAPLDAEARV